MSYVQLQEEIRLQHELSDEIVKRTAVRAGLPAESSRVLEGEPGPALCDFARSEQADAIVIGIAVAAASSGRCSARSPTMSCATRRALWSSSAVATDDCRKRQSLFVEPA